MTTNEQITKETYNAIADSYIEHIRDSQPEIRAMLDSDIDTVIKYFNTESLYDNNVLIVGAGDGMDGLIFNTMGFRSICNDFSSSMKTLAIQKGFPENDYILSDIRECILKNEFDIVWASTCLYNINKEDVKNIVIPKLYNSLLNNGIFYINLFIGNGEIMEEMPESFGIKGSRLYAYYQKNEIMSLLEQIGFKILNTIECNIFGKDFIRIFAQK